MPDNHLRHPVKNFFIKRAMQRHFIMRVVMAVVIASTLSTAALLFVYSRSTAHGKLYFMYLSDDPGVPASSYGAKGMAEVVLPSFLAAQIISVVVGIGIGLFSSRKIAVPVYKLEKWINHLKNGEFNSVLTFRENDEMKELVQECNNLTESYRTIFSDIKKAARSIAVDAESSAEAKKQATVIIEKLSRLTLSAPTTGPHCGSPHKKGPAV